MADTKKSSRQKMLESMRERFPDRTFADLDAAEPQEGVADLDDAINETLEDYATRQAEYDANDNKLKTLLGTDPDIAEVMQSWIETGDPRVAIVKQFGDDLGMSEEARGKFSEQLTSWRERKAENDALKAQADANWDQSVADLEAWGNENGLTLEQKRDVMLRLLAVTFNGMVNKYGVDDFKMAYDAMNFDNAVAEARAAGEVAGRNEKIAEKRRERSVAAALPPAFPGGQGRAAEKKPKRNRDIWDNLSK